MHIANIYTQTGTHNMVHMLPFLPLLEIACMLPLQDSLSLVLTCRYMFDVVFYVYGHTRVLDFYSTLHPQQHYIHLPEAFITRILYAHTRACTVLHFNLPPWFYTIDSLAFVFLALPTSNLGRACSGCTVKNGVYLHTLGVV